VEREYNKYIIVATSLGEEVSAGQVVELYRMRWEIELAFKRLKSLFGYGEVPMKLDKSARAWFYGKLLLAALCETLVNKGCFSPSGAQFPG
jgi:IS4 transposase